MGIYKIMPLLYFLSFLSWAVSSTIIKFNQIIKFDILSKDFVKERREEIKIKRNDIEDLFQMSFTSKPSTQFFIL